MKVYQRKVNNVCILDLEGKITIGEGDVLMRESILHILEQGERNILLNMARITYMDSSGVGELISCYQTVNEEKGVFKLLNISTKIKNLLHIAQILSVFEYFNNEEQAIASFS